LHARFWIASFARNDGRGFAMTFDEVRKIALAWPEVEDGCNL
jgi:hypothetical protein